MKNAWRVLPALLISILVCISLISRQSGVVSDAGSAIIGCDHQITRRPAWYRWVGGGKGGGGDLGWLMVKVKQCSGATS